ncbi:MAG: hypothetical protein EXQ96_07545 [Alphaproteobacteria bacterium]|nr:hypothetical protein [Alphaproteobacteria bacterium]
MFGISVAKLLLLAAVMVAVWQGFRLYRRIAQVKATRNRAAAAAAVQELRACRVCGSYVAARDAERCGRGDCPASA